MTVQSSVVPTFDPLDPAYLDDPYPVYQRLRATGPLLRMGATQWVASHYEPVAALLRDPRLRNEWPEAFQRGRIGDGAVKDFLMRLVLYREDAEHASLRRLLNAMLRRMPPARIREYTSSLVDERLTVALREGHLEAVRDLARTVPLAVACELVGVPEADRAAVGGWGGEIIKAFTISMPEADRPAVNGAVQSLRDYLSGMLAAPPAGTRLAAVAADVAAATGGVPAPAELVDNIAFLLVSGFTTTVHLVANVCATLASQPDVLARLRADRSLVPTALDEILRFDAPLQLVSRVASEAVQFGGQTIRRGRVVHLLLGSANRDPRQFADPDRLDITRTANPHLSFGAGAHACLGALLGRAEGEALLSRVVERCAVFAADGPARRRPMQVFRTYDSVPVRVR
jgi:cytochrome P450